MLRHLVYCILKWDTCSNTLLAIRAWELFLIEELLTYFLFFVLLAQRELFLFGPRAFQQFVGGITHEFQGTNQCTFGSVHIFWWLLEDLCGKGET